MHINSQVNQTNIQQKYGFLGVDFGMRHVGIAYSENGIAAAAIATVSRGEVISFLTKFCKENPVTTIVIGLPDRETAVRRFGKKLQDILGIAVVFWDETLSSRSAQKTLIASGVARRSRREKEHAVAAALILQSYIDHHS